MFKKILVYFIIAFIICAAGYISGRISSYNEIAGLEKSIDNIKGELKKQAKRNNELVAGLADAERENSKLIEGIRELTVENKKLIGKIGNIGSGISEDINGLQSVISEIEKVIEENKNPENNNNN